MKRIKDDFPRLLLPYVPLAGKLVLEVGCGDGRYSQRIADECEWLNAIDPSNTKLEIARSKGIFDGTFEQGVAENLQFSDGQFDVVIFTLSFHHIPVEVMHQAINEAVRVVGKDGHIVFLEPGVRGSFFEAEIRFRICDGDERRAKEEAQKAINNHERLTVVTEFEDEVVLRFEGYRDFIATMLPKRNFGAIPRFLHGYDYVLLAERFITICKPNK